MSDTVKQKSNPIKPNQDILDQNYWCDLVWYARKPGLLKNIAEHMYNDELEWVGELDGEPIDQEAFLHALPTDDKFKKECKGYDKHDLDSILKSIKRVQVYKSDWLPDGEEGTLLNSEGDWQHGFNSGCLAILREIDLRQQQKEEPHVCFSDMSFPWLDS